MVLSFFRLTDYAKKKYSMFNEYFFFILKPPYAEKTY